ncbi:hypothetical protein [Helicobacter salomonis]|uniref:hypothetical protein n=1 Tax=Helicobacter salomonis TaxID=56878 RepID=UPI000CF0A2CD|nr:hypothetical protein [Helicobacter salomonis]
MKMQGIFLALFLAGVLHAQSGYCSDECEGSPGERLPPMEFHWSLPHSIEHYRTHPKARARMLKRCQEAFQSTLKINYMSQSFKQDCDNARQADQPGIAP